MKNKIQKSFDQIHATDQMKINTYTYLKKKMNRHMPNLFSVRSLVTACVILFLCINIGAWYFLTTPVSYLSIDINPSIELTLNRFDQVILAESKNPEGELLLKQLKLTGKDYLTAVKLLIESDSMQDFLLKDSSLTFTVASPKADQLLTKLENNTAQYHGTCQSADMETAHAAHQCGMSLGKYQIYLYLLEYNPSITLEECQNMTMHQLHSLLSQYEYQTEETPIYNNGHSSGHGGHHSHGN